MRKFLLAVLVAVIAASLGVGLAFASVHKRAPSKAGSAALHANALASDPVLLGDSSVAATSDGGKGTSESFGYTATTTGTATNLNAYLTSKRGAGLGLYAHSGSKPGALLDSCSLASNTSGWVSCSISKGVAITAGTRYWIAVYAGSSSKTIAYRDTGSKGSNLDYSGTGLANPYAIVHQWSSNPASLYVGGTTGTTTSTTTTPATTTTTPTTTTTTTTPTTSTTTSTTTTTPPPPPPSGAIVGVAADPIPTCAETVSAASGLDAALSAAPAGSTVCLKRGTTFGNISFDTASTKTVTVDGQGDTVGSVSLDQKISNLTVQGMNSQGFGLLDPSTGGVVFQYNTVSHVAAGIAVNLDPTAHGQSGGSTGVVVRYNQLDHVGECLQDDGDATTFSHNVCGPGIAYGDKASTDPGHYVQTGGEDNMVVDNNAFIGPADPTGDQTGIHLNVFHDWGTSDNLQFNNNLLYHDDSIGQALLEQDGHFDNVSVNNNVAVEEDQNTAYTFWLDATHTGSFSNNTTVTSYWGNLVTIPQKTVDYASSTGMTAANNLTTGTNPAGHNNDCGFSSDVTQSNNYTGDGCSRKTFNGQWQTTSYAPSLPFSAPPAGWYQPSGLTGVGYQGTVGP